MGFMPLGNQRAEQDIPLSNVKSHTSVSGARKAKHGALYDVDMQSEKKGTHGRRRLQNDLSRTSTGDEFALNAMGRLYNKIIGFSPMMRYLVYVVPVATLLAVPLVILPLTDHVKTPTLGTSSELNRDPNKPNPTLFMLFVWIEVTWLALWIGKVVAQLLPPIFMFFCGVVSSGTRKYATVLRALEIPFSLFFSALASWCVFKYFFQDDSFEWIKTLKNILLGLYISSAVLLGEKAIVQLISITYHQRSFANRIKDSKREVHLLGLLYDASRTLFPMYCPEFTEEDYIINNSIELRLAGKRGRSRDGSATPMRLIGDVGRIGDKITSVFGNIASEITGKQVFNPNSAHSVVVEALEKARTSEAMARRIWMSFVVEGNEALSVHDICEVLGPAHKEEAEECFAAIDADQNGDISLDEMVRKVLEIGKERKALVSSMKDIGEALAVFDQVLLAVVLVICIIIFLIVFQSSFVTTLATAGTTLLSLSFVFAVTTQEFLGSCIFLFVKHPYDVGDRVDITGPEKQQLLVEKISLLYTVFTRIDRMQVVQVPNIVLNNLWVENVTRSKAMKEIIDINVSFDTSFEDIELLRSEMEKFVRAPENNRDFQPDLSVNIGGVGELDMLNLKIFIKHKSNWHNETVRLTRRSKFMCALALALRRVPIHAPGGGSDALGAPENPSYSVAVTDDLAAAARAKAKKAQEAARLANMTVSRQASNATIKQAEERAAAEINTNDPLAGALEGWGYDNSPNTRDASAEAVINETTAQWHRSRDSQRGRRKAGDHLPPMAFGDGGTPAVQLTRAATTSTRGRMSYDVERQASEGLQPPNPAMYAGAAYATIQEEQRAAGASYNSWQNPPMGSPPSGASLGQAPPRQNAPRRSVANSGGEPGSSGQM